MSYNEVTDINDLVLENALNASLFRLSIKRTIDSGLFPREDLVTEAEVYPGGLDESNGITIFIANSADLTAELKTYIFDFKPLKYVDGVSDEFIIEPEFSDNALMKMGAKIIRRINFENNEILENEIIEQVNYEPIDLFLSNNYLSTNIIDAEISVVYPVDDFENRFYANNTTIDKLINLKKEEIEDQVSDALNKAYFKNAIISNDDGINISALKVNVDCLTSNQDSFSINSEGDMNLNNLNANNKITSKYLEYEQMTNVSLSTLKTDKELFTNGLNLINKSDIYSYYFKGQEKKSKKHFGLVIGDGFKTPEEVINEENTGVDVYAMVSISWQAIKEMSNEIEKLKKSIKIMEGEINGL